MYCKNCGGFLNDNQAICLQCGVKVGEGNRCCSNCGKPVDPAASVCMNCGVALKGKNARSGGNGNLAGQNKTTIALVCFFLGGIGIHNFMMGETKKGIVKIVFAFLCGISGILALIDFIRILTDTYEVNPDKAF